jgi:hypothetical protein
VIGAVVPAALAAPSPKATGDVDWVYGSVTGNVTFSAQGTPADAKGELVYTDSTGARLHGAVAWYVQIDPKTAVFGGTITEGSAGYLGSANPYFVAKVVDNGTPRGGWAGQDRRLGKCRPADQRGCQHVQPRLRRRYRRESGRSLNSRTRYRGAAASGPSLCFSPVRARS